MAHKRHFSNKRQKARRSAPPPPPLRMAQMEKSLPVAYGKPFVLMEDENKNTFAYKGGVWIPHTMSIAECRQECQVNELPQKVNRMTRYEVRCPLAMES
jgi:hypothetical protein